MLTNMLISHRKTDNFSGEGAPPAPIGAYGTLIPHLWHDLNTFGVLASQCPLQKILQVPKSIV